MSDTAIVQVRNLHRRFGNQTVLNGVNLEIMRGEILVVVGRSGTGKSAFLKHVAGLLRPDRGRIVVMGKDLLRPLWIHSSDRQP